MPLVIALLASTNLQSSMPIQAAPTQSRTRPARVDKTLLEKSLMNAGHHNKKNEFAKALISAKQAIRLDPRSAEAYFQKAVADLGLHSFVSADAAFKKAIELNPGHEQTLAYRADFYLRFGRTDKALADMEAVLKLAPADLQNLPRAQKLVRQCGGKWSEKRWQNAVSPKHNILARALELEESKQEKAAIDLYTQYIKDHPDYSTPYEYRGSAYKYLGLYVNAIADFSKAIKLMPTSADYYRCRGDCYWSAGRKAEGIDDYKTAVYVDSPSTMARSGLTRMLYESGRLDEAIKEASDLIEVRGSLAETFVLRGDCYVKKQNYSNALKDYFHALKYDVSETPSIYKRLADVYEKMGEKEKAARYRKRAQRNTF